MKKMLFAVIIAAIASLAVFADIAPAPGKSPNRVKKPVVVDTQMDIRLDREATEARLYIPASQIKQLRAELDLLDASDNTAALGGIDPTTKIQTVVSGVFLSLAFIFGGLWLTKNRNLAGGPKAVGVVVVFAAFAAAATLVYANAGPPAEARSISGKMFSQAVHIYGFGSGKIKLELTNEDRVTLVVPNPKIAEAKPGSEE